MAVITIIGAGMMGSALAFPARENGNEVRLVGTPLDREIIETCKKTNRHPKFEVDFPRGITYYQWEEAECAIAGAHGIIGGVSSFGVDWFGNEVLPKIPDGTPVITVTKGLWDTEEGELVTYPDLWEKKLQSLSKSLPLAAIGGPCTSYELVAHDHSTVTFCGKEEAVLANWRQWMETDYYHISLSPDVRGVEAAVALKNGYALGVALTVGLCRRQYGNDTLHYNSQAAVFGQAAKEMSRLLTFMGAWSLDNLSLGVGDLYVTVYGGRTRLVGILLGEGLTIDEAKERLAGVTLESLVVAERVARAVKKAVADGKAAAEDFPLLLHIDSILTRRAPAPIPYAAFEKNGF